MPCPLQRSWFDHPNKTWWGVQGIKAAGLIVMTDKCVHADRQRSHVHCILYITLNTYADIQWHMPLYKNAWLVLPNGKCMTLKPVQVFSTKRCVVIRIHVIGSMENRENKEWVYKGCNKMDKRGRKGEGVVCNSLGKSRRKPHTGLKLRDETDLNLTRTVPPAPLPIQGKRLICEVAAMRLLLGFH